MSLLAKQSAKSLREIDESISGQLADLTIQRTWVRRALAAKGIELEPEATTASPIVASNGNRNGTRTRPGRRRGSKRGAILELMRTEPERVWLPSEVRAGLIQQGIDVTVEAVRVTLRRMGADDELVRPDDGNGWKVAPDIPSSGEPSATDLSEKAPLFRESAH